MEQDHSAPSVDVEEHARNSVLSEAASHLIDAASQRLANGHSYGPTEFHGLDVLADGLPILGGKPP